MSDDYEFTRHWRWPWGMSKAKREAMEKKTGPLGKPTSSTDFVPRDQRPRFTDQAQPIPRQCGVVEDHGSYGMKCWKHEGHSGPHHGSMIDLEDMPTALQRQSTQEPADEFLPIVKPTQKPAEPSDALPATYHERQNSVALAAMGSDLAAIARRFETFEHNVHQLNLVAGQLVEKIYTPLKAELATLRMNLDKPHNVVTVLEGIASHLDKQLGLAMKLRGATDGQVEGYRAAHGIDLDIPTQRELTESGVRANEIGTEALRTPAEIAAARSEPERARDIEYVEAIEAENAALKKRLAAIIPQDSIHRTDN